MIHSNISYPVSTTSWDGKFISALPVDAIEKKLDLLQSCGINEVMLAGYHNEEAADFSMEKESRKIGALLRSRGVRTSQHHTYVNSFAPVGSSQKEIVRHLQLAIDYTANLNADIMVFHPGKAVSPNSTAGINGEFRRQLAASGFDSILQVIAENLRAAGDYAAEKGVRIALENVDGSEPLCNIAELPRLLRMTAHPRVGLCLDTGHAWCKGISPERWIDALPDLLFTTHIHDNHGVPPMPQLLHGDEHLSPGFGTIPWREIILKFHRSGYRETINFETGPWPLSEPAEGYRCAIQYWRLCEQAAEELEKVLPK